GDRERMIAAAEAGDVADQDVVCVGGCETMFEIETQLSSAVEVAAHVRANTDVDFGRRCEVKVGVETGDAVNLIQRHAGPLRQSLKFRLRQEAMALLDGSQIVEDHGASRVKRRPTFLTEPLGRNLE